MTVSKYIEKAVRTASRKIFLYFGDEEISYEEFDARINQRSNYFKSLGVGKKDAISLLLPNCPEFLYNWFALTKIGAIMVPINNGYKESEAEYVLKHSDTKFLITHSSFADMVESLAKKRVPPLGYYFIDSVPEKNNKPISELAKNFEPTITPIESKADDPVSILYTSGTTGPPKGCVLPNDYYTITAENEIQSQGLTSEDRVLTHLPLFHMNAQSIATMPVIAATASMALMERFSATKFWEQIKKYKPTIFYYIGSILSILEKFPENDGDKTHGVSRCIGGGANLEQMQRCEKRFNMKVSERYGSTEDSTVTANYYSKGPNKLGSCGVPGPGRQVKIIDDSGNELPYGQKGEILAKGKPMMLEYYKDAKATSEALVDGWFYTGDYGYLDADGFLYFMGRKKDILRRSGENISAVEVEMVLKSHPKVFDAAVIGVPDDVRGEEVKAYIMLKSGETEKSLPPEEIISYCDSYLAYFKIPRYLEYRNDFPRTATQRIQKFILKKEKDLTANSFDREKGK